MEITAAPDRESLAARYARIRTNTLALCEPLSAEDMQVQSMPDVSPTKWHLAHTTWFFETFVLESSAGFEPFDPAFRVLYNSYYQQVGDRHPRPRRGLLSRPSLSEVLVYRSNVDERMARILEEGPERLVELIELGLNHEQQHQELLLMDVKHVLSVNPLRPSYRPEPPIAPSPAAPALRWITRDGGLCDIGHTGEGFGFDNESPRHRQWLENFSLASRPITNGELLEFVEDGGYSRPELWLSDAWDRMQATESWDSPMYWERRHGDWMQFTMHGLEPLRREDPATHLSYYEADAFARWAGARLPTEAEWESVAAGVPVRGNLLESARWHPRAAANDEVAGFTQLFGDVWEWTRSAYSAYPGYAPATGAVGEYNGKFMANQFVLRGGCWATPRDHVRATYRNFFHPWTRWHFGGIRLAKDA